MTDETKAPVPVGVPWALIIQIIQVILALITYLTKREAVPAWKAELERICWKAETALNTAETMNKAGRE